MLAVHSGRALMLCNLLQEEVVGLYPLELESYPSQSIILRVPPLKFLYSNIAPITISSSFSLCLFSLKLFCCLFACSHFGNVGNGLLTGDYAYSRLCCVYNMY